MIFPAPCRGRRRGKCGLAASPRRSDRLRCRRRPRVARCGRVAGRVGHPSAPSAGTARLGTEGAGRNVLPGSGYSVIGRSLASPPPPFGEWLVQISGENPHPSVMSPPDPRPHYTSFSSLVTFLKGPGVEPDRRSGGALTQTLPAATGRPAKPLSVPQQESGFAGSQCKSPSR